MEEERREQEDSSPIASTSQDQEDISPQSSEEVSDEFFEPERQPSGVYSKLEIPRYANELVRNDVSSNVGASLANAFLLDQESRGLLNSQVDVKTILLDKSKVNRAKQGVKRTAFERHNEKSHLHWRRF